MLINATIVLFVTPEGVSKHATFSGHYCSYRSESATFSGHSKILNSSSMDQFGNSTYIQSSAKEDTSQDMTGVNTDSFLTRSVGNCMEAHFVTSCNLKKGE